MRVFSVLSLSCALSLLPLCGFAAGPERISEPYAPQEEITIEDLLQTADSQVKLPDGTVLSYKRPVHLAESFIQSDTLTAATYNGVSNRVQIVINVIRDNRLTAAFGDFQSFKDYVLAPFSDKEHLIYGEYDILQQQESPDFVLALEGFLKKPEDNILPDMYNLMYQRSGFDGTYLWRATCQAQGQQHQQQETKALYKEISPLCHAVVDSVKLQPAQ